MKKVLQCLLLFTCVVTPVFAASQRVEEAKARAAIRDELDWKAMQAEETEKARAAISREIDRDAIRRELERLAAETIRNTLDLSGLTRSEEEAVRQRVRSSIDQQAIYNEEYSRIAQRVYAERFQHGQIMMIESDIHNRKYAEIEDALTRKIREEVSNRAKADAEAHVYPLAHKEQSLLVYQRVVAQFLNPEFRAPIEAKARQEEIERIEQDEKAKVRATMQAAIRAEIENLCDTGQIKLVSDEEKAKINADVVAQKTELASAKYRAEREREYQVSLSEDQKRALQKAAFEKVVGTETERAAKIINERSLKLLEKVRFTNSFIRLFNWFMFIPWTRIDEWNEAAYVQMELSKEFS